jgi:hypothetical protein
MIYYNSKSQKAQAGTKTSMSDHGSDLMTNIMHGISTLGMSTVGDAISGFSPRAAAAVEKYSLGMIPYTHQESRIANRSATPNYKANRVRSLAGAMNGAAAGVLTGGVLKSVIPGLVNGTIINKATKALGTETGLLSKAYKVNPFAEKLNNANKSYRIAGLDSYADFLESGVVRSKRTLPENATIFDAVDARPTAFPSFQKGAADMRYLPEEGGVVYETNVPTFKRGDINPVTGIQIKGRHYAHRPIDMETGAVITDLPAKNVKVFDSKPHWRDGFQEVGKYDKKYSSTIDWGAWNKEIPTNFKLMREYSAIEQTAKKAGTWLKNRDGSRFEGSPEQYIQQRSENFKKWFADSKAVDANGKPIAYHHQTTSTTPFEIFDAQQGKRKISGENHPNLIFTSPDESMASSYGFGHRYNLYAKTSSPKYLDYNGRPWNGRKLEPAYDPNPSQGLTTNNQAQRALQNGYDSFEAKNVLDYGNITSKSQREIPGTTKVFFKSNQLKSTVGNNGMFNIADPSIYKAIAPVALTTGAYLKTKKRNGGILYK